MSWQQSMTPEALLHAAGARLDHLSEEEAKLAQLVAEEESSKKALEKTQARAAALTQRQRELNATAEKLSAEFQDKTEALLNAAIDDANTNLDAAAANYDKAGAKDRFVLRAIQHIVERRSPQIALELLQAERVVAEVGALVAQQRALIAYIRLMIAGGPVARLEGSFQVPPHGTTMNLVRAAHEAWHAVKLVEDDIAAEIARQEEFRKRNLTRTR